MAVEYSDFVAWRHSEITRKMMEDVAQIGADAASEMMSRSTGNPERDQFLRGFVQGSASVISWQPEFTKTEEEIDEDKNLTG